ncbi:MAG: nucleoside deaminase [Deltaproteobacteria bacterium]|nr:nucleoside deaminase [Deltaproteobacteria bacterium]
MNLALEQARKAAAKGEVPVGSVVVSETGSILGTGHNEPLAGHDPTAHAEIRALRRAALSRRNYRLLDSTIYVTMEPCIMCVGALLCARVKRLVFGARDHRFGAVESMHRLLYDRRLNHEVEVIEGILEAECADLLTSFFHDKRSPRT